MEKPKRKYQKRNTEKVISVTHYLNTRLKSKLIDGKVCFPLYIMVYHNGQTTTVKSRLDKYVAEDDFENFEQQFKDEIVKEGKTIKDKLRRTDDTKEPIKSQYFLQGVKSLTKTLHKVIKIETKLIIACKDNDFIEHIEKYREDNSANDYHRMLTLTDFSYRVRLINWDEFSPYFTLHLLVSMMPSNEELKAFHQSLNQSLTLEDMYEDVINSYFPNGATVEDWRVGKFQQSATQHYRQTEDERICQSYLLIISNLFNKYRITE